MDSKVMEILKEEKTDISEYFRIFGNINMTLLIKKRKTMNLRENGTYVPSSESKDIKGWLAFFLFQIACGGIISFVSIFFNISLESYEGFPELYAYIGMACDMLCALGLLGAAAYTLYAFIKRKPNAVSLGKIVVTVIMLTNIAILLMGELDDSGLGSAQRIVQTLVWNVIWLIYLSKSEQVERLFPREQRKVYKRDFLLLFIFVLPMIFLGIVILTTLF